MPKALWQNHSLIFQLTWRDISGRYRGSLFGLGWSFINPFLMLIVYTFVFSVLFKARWGIEGEDNKSVFAVILFVGLICHSFLAEILMGSPALIRSNVNYVKKVVFPLEVLSVVTLLSALFHSLMSFCVLMIVVLALNGFIHWTAIIAPIIFLPLVVLALGLSWILASIGTYFRDISQAIGIITTLLLFLSPVFYPISIMPEQYQVFFLINPLTFIIEQARLVLLDGVMPDWKGLGLYSVASLLVAQIGYWWFQRTRNGFADVL
ncbi:MAG: lipopolysaccharide transport system permease protein [Candidatus Azotimanducaceae bacterium]|jgi:lipopolysaccharide transport system permease protein